MVQDSNAKFQEGETPVRLRDLYDVNIADTVSATSNVVIKNNAVEIVAPASALAARNAAGASYVQADAATWVAAINAMYAALQANGIMT
jgi:uncharacterized protein with beta-barrel porin domain